MSYQLINQIIVIEELALQLESLRPDMNDLAFVNGFNQSLSSCTISVENHFRECIRLAIAGKPMPWEPIH